MAQEQRKLEEERREAERRDAEAAQRLREDVPALSDVLMSRPAPGPGSGPGLTV